MYKRNLNQERFMIKRKTPIQKEMLLLKKQEQRFLERHQEKENSRLNRFLEDKIPDKLQETEWD